MPRGGPRSGAGRPAGSENRDTAAARQALSELASGHVEAALSALADIAASGQSEAARVTAACAILDRVYGRPRSAPVSAELRGLPYSGREDPLGGLTLGNW
jgi:hypothetical protein